MNYQAKKILPIVGMVFLFAFAAIQVVRSEAQEVKQALPATLNNLSEVKTVEIKDESGQLILSGNFGNAIQDGEELERETVLAATSVMPQARGTAEIEISTNKDSFTVQELELSLKNLSAGGSFKLFIDGQEVFSFTANHEGKAELEFTNKPLK
jgi:hypothetical protein